MRMRGAGERAVARAGRTMPQVNYEKVRAERETALVAFAELATTLFAATDTITDRRVRALMTTVTKDLLDRHYQHLDGFLEVVAKQFARQINRDITPEKPLTPRAGTFWQQLALGALRG